MEKQTLKKLHQSKTFVIDANIKLQKVSYMEYFSICCRYCITNVPTENGHGCNLKITAELKYTKKVSTKG